MRIVIASVLTHAQLSDLLCPVTETVRRLLAHATVSAIYLLVARSHRQLFDGNIASCDSRLKTSPSSLDQVLSATIVGTIEIFPKSRRNYEPTRFICRIRCC
jgi:hypothetical protein